MADSSAAGRKFWSVLKGAGGEASRLWIAAAALAVVLLGAHSCASIEAGQVAVRINNVTGGMEVITQPGAILRLPFGIHDVSPQTFHMVGNTNVSSLVVKELQVRAADGSNFVFNDTTLLFRAIPGQAAETLRDSGLDHAYSEWLVPY